jgi:hypothetical protein
MILQAGRRHQVALLGEVVILEIAVAMMTLALTPIQSQHIMHRARNGDGMLAVKRRRMS